MKAIILAAGSNNEISNIVGEIPKSLIPIENNNILEVQLNVLHSFGIDDVSVVKGYKSELIDIPGIKYYQNNEYESTNILYTLFCAEKEFDDDLLIIYGDVIFDRECIERLLSSSSDISIGVSINLDEYKRKNIEKLELVYFDAENNINKIGKKLNDGNEAFGQFSGLIKCTKKGIEIIKNNYNYFKMYNKYYTNALISEMLDDIVNLGIKIPCVMIERGWIKINSEDDYKKLNSKSNGNPNIVSMKTDWALRSNMYNNIQWVNKEETLEVMVELSNITGNKPKILDVGVGTGKVLKFFKENFRNSMCYGIDISNEMMSKIDKEYDIKLFTGSVEDLSIFESNSFDVVTARMSIHHVANLEKAMNEVYRVLKKGGTFVICEGVPPNKETLDFYKKVFSYKETRNTFLVDDLINMMHNSKFNKITTRTVITKDMSMNNWLVNAGIPFRNKDIISKMHYNCNEKVKQAYNMKFVNDDILMEWKFVIVSGIKYLNN